MKTVLILVFLIRGLLSLGQEYQIDSTSIWVQKEEYGETFEWWTYNYYLTVGDTVVINDTTYFELFLHGKEQYDLRNYPPAYEYFTDLYYGAIRSDSGRILFVEPYSNHSITLYDFNLAIGDTIKTVVGKNKTITGIYNLSSGRRRYLTNDTDFFLNEGIGSNHGLYNVKHLFLDFGYPVRLQLGCYYQDDTMVIMIEPQICSYFNPVGIDDPPVKNPPKILSKTYYNLLGQEIDKPRKGFYIECLITEQGIISNKCFIP